MNKNNLHYILDILTVLMIIVDRADNIAHKIKSIIQGDGKDGSNK